MTYTIYAFEPEVQPQETGMSEVQEQEINDMFAKFTAAFDYIKQTFVNANQFAEQVKALQAQVTQLTQDFEQLKQHNHALDEAINAVTRERDEARGEVQNLRYQLSQVTMERDQAASNFQIATDKVNALLAELEQVKRERDDGLQASVYWEDQHKQVKSKLDDVHKALGITGNGNMPWPQAVNQ
jgi:chromosome segregation ATPase